MNKRSWLTVAAGITIAVFVGFGLCFKAIFRPIEITLTGIKFSALEIFLHEEPGRDGCVIWAKQIPDAVIIQMKQPAYNIQEFPMEDFRLKWEGYNLVRWALCTGISATDQKRIQNVLLRDLENFKSQSLQATDVKSIGDARDYVASLMSKTGTYYSYWIKQSEPSFPAKLFLYLINFDEGLMVMVTS